jgi:hypothetical protein
VEPVVAHDEQRPPSLAVQIGKVDVAGVNHAMASTDERQVTSAGAGERRGVISRAGIGI